MMNVLFVAAENGALEGGKVGGIGDVIRELPPVLAAFGCRMTVITPAYGFLHQRSDAKEVAACWFRFRGGPQSARIFEVQPSERQKFVTHLVIDHPALGFYDHRLGRYLIYADDPPDRPFFTDGSRFALFCAAVAAAVSEGRIGRFDLLHLHDWHAAMVMLLGRFHPDFSALRDLRWVYSIHNLAFQGVRPLRGGESSLEAWFPEMHYDWHAVSDPRWHDCVNLMATGIRLADRVHTVSESYAEEIRKPDNKPQFYGGEGLEADLERAYRNGRLIGILNGCRYPKKRDVKRPGLSGVSDFKELLALIRDETIRWSGGMETVPSSQFVAFARALRRLEAEASPVLLLTSVSRVGEQKVLLLRRPGSSGKTGLEGILEAIGPSGFYILLGGGDPEYERFLTAVSARYENFIFVNGYSDPCARALYATGDLFLMPSSFEPCGLGQMFALREGQPCVVHWVGGLKDTVIHAHNGFVFDGDTVEAQVDGMVDAVMRGLKLKRESPEAWDRLCHNAAASRFTWEKAAERYMNRLYKIPPPERR